MGDTIRQTSQRIMFDMYRDLKVSVLGGNLRESGSKFQRTLPEYTRLDLKRSILGISILSFPECRGRFRDSLAVREGGTFQDIILCIRIPLL